MASKAGFSRLWGLGFLSVLLAGGGFIWWWQAQHSADSGTVFQSVVVERGSVVQSVLATGELNPVRTVQVGSQISGNIKELLADFNSEVRQGDVVALLDPAIYQANVSLAEAEVQRAAAAFDLTRVQLDRIQSLHDRAMISDSERDEARARMQQAQASLRIARHQLEKAELELGHCTIRSPVNGIVISRNVDVGQTVAASLAAPVLFEIAEDLTQMEINTFVSEADIGHIREGQSVLFRVDAYRETPFKGEVWQVRNAPLSMENVVSYDAVVRVKNPELLLMPGMTAEVDFITAERDNVLRVRNSALRARLPDGVRPPEPELPEGSDWRRVYRLRMDGSVEAIPVRVGISDGIYTEIVDGLSEDDRLVSGLSLQRSQGNHRSGPSLLQGRQQQF